MLHLKKIDWSILPFLLSVCVLTVISACVQPSGPLGGQNLLVVGTAVSSVRITLAQPTLATGEETQATVVATSANGAVVGGHADFSSQNPSIATVSSNGVVTALTAGVSMIQATVASRAASTIVTVKSPVSAVAVVAVALDSSSLAIGHSANASATAKDSAGNLITGQKVTWASASPTVATVSSTGTVTAVTAGSATIEAMVAGKSGSASLNVITVPGSSVLAFYDFNDGKPGPFNDWASPAVDYPADPTGSGRGKVVRILYTGYKADPASSDHNMEFDTIHHYRYGETLWFKGDVYMPSGVVSGGPKDFNNQRKLLDYFRVNNARLFLTRETDGTLHWVAGDIMTGVYVEDRYIGSTGVKLLDDTWYTIEMKMVTNSADGIRDGRLEFYVNNPSSTPDFVVSSGLGWITEKSGGTYFNSFRFGTQLTIHYPTDSVYSEYRYWDNVSFSTTRMGR
ncbi:MAG: Ig-like domain-containing protein [Gemmatimonadota bacterium]|nr:Ig-like domain-containing protein [Gemmatimonadota bacterium]